MPTADKNEVNVETNVAPSASGFFSRPAAWALCLTLLPAVGMLRIVSTYHVFNHTIDEPPHLACGIEWWEKGVYDRDQTHSTCESRLHFCPT